MWRCLFACVMVLACRAPGPSGGGGGEVRLVSLHDVTTEAVVRVGAGGRLVGVAEPVGAAADVRTALAGVPRVAGLESILALAPTAVLGLAVVGEQDPELVAALRRRGIDVFLGRPRTLDDVYEIVGEVGRRARAEEGARRVVAAARARVAGWPAVDGKSAPRVFVYDCCDPPFTAGGETLLSELIARAGARNVFAELAAGWTHVSWEEVVARAPTHVVIDVIDDYTADGAVKSDRDARAAAAALARKREALAAVPALARLPVLALPLGMALGGLGGIEAVERLRALAAHGAGGAG